MDGDTVQRFVLEGYPVRGEIVRLDATWQAVLTRHDYPEAVRDVLGELLVAAALLSSTIKYDGSLTIQLQGDGPLSMVIVECTSHRTLRGLARWTGDVNNLEFADLIGQGRLAITLDPGGDAQYQSIVNVEADGVGPALERYFHRSEQVHTRLWLATDPEVAAGFLLQRLPERELDDEVWNRAVTLADSIRADELLGLPSQDLLHRLYHEDDVRIFDPEPVSFRCTCSRERVRVMLRALGTIEIHDILRTEGKVDVTCEFCNQRYAFDTVDAELLFTEQNPPDLPSTRH